MDETYFGVSFDAGALINLYNRNLNLGLSVKNLGFVTGTEDPIPMEIAAGLGFRLWRGKFDYLNLTVDCSKIINTDNIYAGAGFEGYLMNILAIRLGFRFNNAFETYDMSFEDIQKMIYFSGGAGVYFADGIMVDYSLTPMGDLGYVHRLGIKWRFGGSVYERRLAEEKAVLKPKAMEVPEVSIEEGEIKEVSFKPNVPQEKVKEWKLDIKTSGGKIVKTFSGFGEVPKNLTWDGTDAIGKIASADAGYVFDFKAKDMDGKMVKTIGHILAPKRLEFYELEEKRFIPVKNREMLVAPVTLLISSDEEERKKVPFVMVNKKIKNIKSWKFEILNKSGSLIKRFRGEKPMPSYLVWDGKDYRGDEVKNFGQCKYILTIEGQGGGRAVVKEKKVIRNPFVIASKTKKLKMTRKVYFDVGSGEVHNAMAKRLAEIAAEIKKHRNAQVYIQGHSSREGSRAFNVMLSRKRAKSVLRHLVEKFKISPLSITTVGYGAKIPAASNDTEKGRMKNRRVEIIIMGEIPR